MVVLNMKGGQDIAYLSHFHTIHIVLTKNIQKLVVWYLRNHETVKEKQTERKRSTGDRKYYNRDAQYPRQKQISPSLLTNVMTNNFIFLPPEICLRCSDLIRPLYLYIALI